jgi:hypothetical protein
MLRRAIDFFKKLLPGGKRARGISIEQLITQVLSGNLRELLGESTPVEVSRIGLGEFEGILTGLIAAPGAAEPGHMMNACAGADHPSFRILYPKEFIAAHMDRVKNSLNPKSDTEALNALITGTDGSLSQLLLAETADALFEKAGILRVIEACRPDDAAALVWHASGCAIYRIESGGSFLIAMLDEARDDTLRALLAGNSAFISFVQKETGGPGTSTGDGSPAVPHSRAIHRPKEFLLGRLFLSPAAFYGERAFTSVFRESAVTRQARQLSAVPGAWFKLNMRYGTVGAKAYCFFPEPKAGKSAAIPHIEKVALAALARDAAKLLSRESALAPEKTGVEAAGVPDFPENDPVIMFTADVFVDDTCLPCRILLETGHIAPLLKNLLRPQEMELLRLGPAQLMRALQILNLSLVRKNPGMIFRHAASNASSPELLKPGLARPILFHEFAGLLEDRDIRIIIQNHLIREVPPGSFGSLFRYYESSRSSQGEPAEKLVHFADSGEERLKGFLPEKYLKEWEHHVRLGAYSGCGSEADFVERNIESMKGILRAEREGRLLLSERARHLLKTEFYGYFKKEIDRQLGEARARNMPFADLRSLPRKSLQNLLMHIDNYRLCLALIGSEHEMEFLAANMSRRRRARLKSDFEYHSARYRMGLVDVEEVLAVKEASRKSALALLENTGTVDRKNHHRARQANT